MVLKLPAPEREVIDRAAELDYDKPANWARRVAVRVAEHRVKGITLDEAYAAALKDQSRK